MNDICNMETIKAVITADVVNSSSLAKIRMNALKRSIEQILKNSEIRYSFYRGDSFNVVCEPDMALLTVCKLRTMAIQASDESKDSFIDIRIAIGIGIVEEPFKEMSTAKGEAFILSGREMDQMEKDGPRLSIRCADPVIDTGMAAIALFMDFILRKMTLRQARVINELLYGSTQVKVAGKLHKSQSTINKHANASHWKELERLMEVYQKLTSLISRR